MFLFFLIRKFLNCQVDGVKFIETFLKQCLFKIFCENCCKNARYAQFKIDHSPLKFYIFESMKRRTVLVQNSQFD